jgi:two-component system response regulator FixJ
MTFPAVHTLLLDSGQVSTVDQAARQLGIRSHAYASAEAFLAAADASSAGCVVTDLQVPGRVSNGIQRRLLELDSPLTVIFVATAPSVSKAVLAIRSGAVTVVETPMTSQQLAAEIQEALRISEKRWEHILAVRDARSRVTTLTSREHDTLPGVLRGRTNDAVASDLSVSTRTIERRRRSILERLGVDCFAEVVHLLDTAGQPVFPFLEGRQAGDTQSRPAQEKSPEGHLQRRGSSFDPNLFHWHTGRQARQCPVFPPVQNRW